MLRHRISDLLPLRVSPSGEGLCTPQHCVPDFPQGPQQAFPLTLPLTVTRGVEAPYRLFPPSLLKSDLKIRPVWLVPASLLIQFEDWFVIEDLKDASKELVMQTQLSPAHVESILNAMKEIKLGQELSVLKVQRLLCLSAAVANCYH